MGLKVRPGLLCACKIILIIMFKEVAQKLGCEVQLLSVKVGFALSSQPVNLDKSWNLQM